MVCQYLLGVFMPIKTDTYVRRLVQRDRSISGPMWLVTNDIISPTLISQGRTRDTDKQVVGWRKRIATGQNATTRLVANAETIQYQPGYAYRYLYDKSVDFAPAYGQSRWDSSGHLGSASSSLPSSLSAALKTQAENEAKSAFIKHALELQQKFSSGTFLGELRETLSMLRNPARSLRKRVDQYARDARRNFRRARGTPKARQRVLRDTWLEWSFGVQPLVSDVRSASEALASLRDVVIDDFASGIGRRQAITSSASIGQSINGNILSWDYSIRRVSDYSVRYYGKVAVPLSPEGKRLAGRTFGFDPHDFFPTVWELIPYSFLVDYFTNIGDIITCFSYNTASLRWVVRTEREELSAEAGGFRLRPNLLTQYVIRDELFRPPTFRRSYKAVNRQTYVGPLVPHFEFQLPGFGLKWLNIAALARHRRVSL